MQIFCPLIASTLNQVTSTVDILVKHLPPSKDQIPTRKCITINTRALRMMPYTVEPLNVLHSEVVHFMQEVFGTYGQVSLILGGCPLLGEKVLCQVSIVCVRSFTQLAMHAQQALYTWVKSLHIITGDCNRSKTSMQVSHIFCTGLAQQYTK